MNKLKYETEKEMAQSIDVLLNFKDEQAKDIAKKIEDRPIFIVGMGSSLLFPAKNAKRRAYALIPEQMVEIGYPNNFSVEFFPQDAYVFLSSNLGKTVEIIELAEGLKHKGIDIFGVTANADSKLAEICGKNKYILQGPFEKGVAATKSIIEQGLFYDSVIHYIANKGFPLNSSEEKSKLVASSMMENFYSELDGRIIYAALLADNYYWIDHETGVGEELALKSCEISGKRGIYESGTQILHGRGEVMMPYDLILILNPPTYKNADIQGLCELANKVKGSIVAIGKDTLEGVLNLNAKMVDEFEGYSLLPSGWNLLRTVAYAQNRNIDHPGVAQKYRAK